ncbi:hypothetical protein ACSBR1_012897 [Camellia fascicularis]
MRAMEQSEPVVAKASDFSQRKIARQLDFTVMCRASANAILPDHPQAQLQSKLLALARSQASQLQSQPQSGTQLQIQPRPKQPVPIMPRVAHQGRPQPRPTLPVVHLPSGIMLNIIVTICAVATITIDPRSKALTIPGVVIIKATNLAINGAIGTSCLGTPPPSRKRKYQQLIFGPTPSDQSILGIEQFQQENYLRASATSSSLLSAPVSCTASASMGSSKLTYRSPLADVLRSQDVKELCSLLVIASAEATKVHADRK